VCEEKQPLLRARIETRDKISQRQRVSSGSNVVPALHDDRVRPLAQKAIEPVAHTTMRVGSRHPWAKADLRLDVPKRRSTIELSRRPWFVPAGGEEKDGEDGKDGKDGKGGKAHVTCRLWSALLNIGM
jgi:hypothetical protein